MSNIVNLLVGLHESGIDPQTILKDKKFDFTERSSLGKLRSVLEECLDSDVPYPIIQPLLTNKDFIDILTKDFNHLGTLLKKDAYREAFLDDLQQRSKEDPRLKKKELGFEIVRRMIELPIFTSEGAWEVMEKVNPIFNKGGDPRSFFLDFVRDLAQRNGGVPGEDFVGLVRISDDLFLEGVPEGHKNVVFVRDSIHNNISDIMFDLMDACINKLPVFKKVIGEFKEFKPEILLKGFFWDVFENRYDQETALSFLGQIHSSKWRGLKDLLPSGTNTVIDENCEQLFYKIHQDRFISSRLNPFRGAKIKDIILLSIASRDYEEEVGENKAGWLKDLRGIGSFFQIVANHNKQEVDLDLMPSQEAVDGVAKYCSLLSIEEDKLFICFLEKRAILLGSGEKLGIDKAKKKVQVRP